MKLKKLFALMIAASMVASMSACGSASSDAGSQVASADSVTVTSQAGETSSTNISSKTDSTSAKSAVIDTFTYVVSSPESLSPMAKNVSQTVEEVYERLFDIDPDTHEMYALLADPDRGEYKGYDHESGTTDYEVYIRSNIHDHAGNQLTASDVAFCYITRLKNGTSSWDALVSCEAKDDTTVLFHFSRELDGINDLENYFYDAFVTTEKAFNDSATGLATDMCGTGPYKFVSYTPGSNLVIEAYDDYWGKDIKDRSIWTSQNVKKIVYDISDEDSQKVVALQTGEGDFLENISPIYRDSILEGGNFKSQEYNTGMIVCAMANGNEASICSKEDIRKAIFYIIDQNEVAAAYKGEMTATTVFALPDYPDYDADWATDESYCTQVDTDKASELLKEAGYNGETIKIMCMGMDTFTLGAQVIQNELKEAGLNAELITYEPSTFFSTLAEASSWDIAINASNSYSYNATYWNEMFSTAKTGTNTTQYLVDDSDWSGLLSEIMTNTGHTNDTMAKWLKMGIDKAYYIPLMSDTGTFIYPSNVSEFRVDYGERVKPGSFTFTE